MSVNFNATTPAAPAGKVNVTPQADGHGNLSAYTSITEVEVNGTDVTTQTPINFENGTNITVSNPSAGNIKFDGPSSLPPSGAAGGDLSGTYPNPSVAKVNGGSVPASQPFVGTDSSSRIVAATAGALPNGTTATTQTQGDGSTKVATDAYVDTGLATKQATLTGTGIARNTGACTELSGDVTTSGSNATTVVKVNGASVPASATVVGTNSSRQIVDASSATLSNNTSGTAANLSGTPALPNGTTATTQAAGDNSTKLATDAYVDRVVPNCAPSAGLGGWIPGFGSLLTPLSSVMGASGAGDFTSNRINVLQVFLDNPVTIGHMTWDLIATAIATLDFGIYDSGGSLKSSLGGVSLTAGTTLGVQSSVPTQGSVTLQPGVYYLAWTGTGSGLATINIWALVCAGATGTGPILNKNGNRFGFVTTASSGGVLPNSINVASGFTPQTTQSYPPVLLCEV